VTSVTTPSPGNSGAAQTTTTLYDTMRRPYCVTQPDGTMVTTYDNAGALTNILYSDSTSAVTNVYNRLGQLASVTCNGMTDTLTYNLASQLLTESFSGGPLNGLSVTNGYDNYMRRNQLSLLSPSSQLLASAAYGYAAASRLSTVSDGNGNTVGYTYLANSPLVSQITYQQSGTTRMITTKAYDDLNRLTLISSQPSGSGVPPVSFDIHFVYDAKGRRIQKTVTNAIAVATTNFVYDGWNLIGILAPNSSLRASFLWGNDLSGSPQGAGGVGGLLELSCFGSSQTNSFVAYDGNGNVASLINAASGIAVANYEYGPFGEVIRATGPMAKANPIRFSTKYDDDESDLLYYGYRYYKPSTGTWVNRDPLDEIGFNMLLLSSRPQFGFEDQNGKVNLYDFVQNEPVQSFDRFGLQSCTGGPGNGGPVCGPNVSTPLANLISKLNSVWGGWDSAHHDAACAGLTSFANDPTRGGGPAWLNAWDIDQLWRGNQAWINNSPYAPSCTTQPTCKNSVSVGGQCYYAGSVNYVLFGHMCKLCGWYQWKMKLMIWLYKHNSPNYQPSRDWAVAGYDGWPTCGRQPASDRPKCSPTCLVPYSGPAFQFYWYPYGWN